MKDRQLLYFGGAAAAVMGLGVLCSLCLLCGGIVLLLNTPAPPPAPEVARLDPWRPAGTGPAPVQPGEPANTEVAAPPDSTGGESAPAPAAPISQPAETAPGVVPLEGNVNLYQGPSVDSQIFGVLPFGQRLEVIGRNADSTWWQVTGPGGIAWIEAALVNATNIDGVPVVEAEISPPADEGGAAPAPPVEEGAAPEESSGAPGPSGTIPVSLLEITSPVSVGQPATLTVETAPEASCRIEVTFAGGPSQAAGLAPTVASPEDGRCSWTWDILPEEATPGDWPIRVIVEANGQSNVLSTGFTVQ